MRAMGKGELIVQQIIAMAILLAGTALSGQNLPDATAAVNPPTASATPASSVAPAAIASPSPVAAGAQQRVAKYDPS
jgi:hypothetical protein